MKKLIAMMFIMAVGAFSAFAQGEQTNHEGFIGYSFVRQDVKIEIPSEWTGVPDFTFNRDTDSHGVNAGYTYYFKNKNSSKNGVVGVTGDVGVNFVGDGFALVTVMGGVTVKARNVNYIQPYVRALGGVSSQKVNVATISNVSISPADISGAFALGGGVDIGFKKNTRYKVRLGADYVQTGVFDTRQHNLRLTTGLVF